jgi:hypothetical protein
MAVCFIDDKQMNQSSQSEGKVVVYMFDLAWCHEDLGE